MNPPVELVEKWKREADFIAENIVVEQCKLCKDVFIVDIPFRDRCISCVKAGEVF